MEEIAPLETANPKTDETGETIHEIALPRVKMEDGSWKEYQWDDPDLPPRYLKMRTCMRTDGCSAGMFWVNRHSH